jgi:hypothetical protein
MSGLPGAFIPCPRCGVPVPFDARACNRCGLPQAVAPADTPPTRRPWSWGPVRFQGRVSSRPSPSCQRPAAAPLAAFALLVLIVAQVTMADDLLALLTPALLLWLIVIVIIDKLLRGLVGSLGRGLLRTLGYAGRGAFLLASGLYAARASISFDVEDPDGLQRHVRILNVGAGINFGNQVEISGWAFGGVVHASQVRVHHTDARFRSTGRAATVVAVLLVVLALPAVAALLDMIVHQLPAH